MGTIEHAYDKFLDIEVSIDEVQKYYSKYKIRYLCPVCYDRLLLADGFQRKYLKHYNSEDGHNCKLYTGKSSFYFPQRFIRNELRKTSERDFSIYLVKNGNEYYYQMSIPAFSLERLNEFADKHAYIKVDSQKLFISNDNFAVDKRRFINLSTVKEFYKVRIGSSVGDELTQDVVIGGSNGGVFSYLGSDTCKSDDAFIAKHVAEGGAIYVGKHYLLVSKRKPINWDIDFEEMQIVGGAGLKFYDFVVKANSYYANLFFGEL